MGKSEAIAIKGCREGLRIMVSADADIREILDSLHEKAREHKSFFKGTCNVIVTGREFTQADKLRINSIMSSILPGCPVTYEVTPIEREESVRSISRRNREMMMAKYKEKEEVIKEEQEEKPTFGIQKTILKFIDAMTFDKDDYIDEDELTQMQKSESEENQSDDMTELRPLLCEGNVFIYNGNIKRNCRLRAPGNLIIVGNMDFESEVIAVGNIYIFGKARGRIWAGCNGNGKAEIVSYDLAPDEMRIADVYLKLPNGITNVRRRPERAYLKNDTIYIAENF